MSLVSIVVPVYNVSSYIDWCLESVHNQTYSDIEVICVNDGSTDDSLDKLEKWARVDHRIRIVNKPNGGLSSARNAGIDVAKGDYVCFLDSDDRFHLDACEIIAKTMDQTHADVLTFGADCYPLEAGYPWLIDVLSPRDAVYDGFSLDILFLEKSRPFAWRTACRRSFLKEHHIAFVDGFGEDQVFDFAIYPRSKKTVFISAKLYDYRVSREGSLMDSLKTDYATKMLKHVSIVDHILSDWDSGGFLSQYQSEMIDFAISFALYDALKLPNDSYYKVSHNLKDVLSKYWTKEEIQKLMLSRAVKKMTLSACYEDMRCKIARKILVFDYFAERNGKRAALQKAISFIKR